ncbi:uracil-DNA glycosylase [Pseudarthrobacter sp. PS3-L1]|uniref:uracil-DNA glycosylase n=1 Tax=Pseudarthrobacter sp. PS3-L1 TaxID=3046207 RepID=UPI0024B950CE|nr:uracil-DNA glycosylase [Pseudarthrobacter sp. PS3-L1]MDJ0320586.1 uracil-DNA glycosylase [Pseudarthrobacter sp. PS3-L1]
MTAPASENIRETLLSRRYEPSVGAVNELCDALQATKPGTTVPYVDPIHDVDECRIISLYSNIGEADESGFTVPGDAEAVTRMLGLQWQLGLRPEYVMPWNTHPWHTPGEPNGKFTPDQVSAGLKPLLKFLALVPRASVIVAHGAEANRLATMLLKTEVPLLWRRGLKTYKVRSLSGRAFAGSPARQEEFLADMRVAYTDAMARTGLAKA